MNILNIGKRKRHSIKGAIIVVILLFGIRHTVMIKAFYYPFSARLQAFDYGILPAACIFELFAVSNISEEDIIRNIMEEFSLSQEKASGYVKKY